MIFNDTYKIIRPVTSIRAINIDKKCKHLSNFSAIILWALCYCVIKNLSPGHGGCPSATELRKVIEGHRITKDT
jgi:hypothetical protein